jgi:hypothetical protein
MMMAEKIPLSTANPLWKRTSIGDVKCGNCGWMGAFHSLLCEPGTHWLFCPLCTSTRWFYYGRNA